ncbi:DNA gyrase inhibitor [Raoultella terrigena]|uniref:DNA gyrase inhibitor n=1 Tax=Raoultella terrigena TaxID=577 RepID=A0A4U9D2Z6_RAOTE|nr:DNA gyrase inhibitor [Raoultella terrigena]
MQGQVKIVNFPASSVAMLTHYGQPELINETVARFIERRKTTGYSPLPAARRTVLLRTIRLQRRRMNLRSIFAER